MWLLSAVAVVLGLVGGGAAVGLFTLISLMTHLTLLGNIGLDLPTLRGYHPTLLLIPIAVGGGLVVSAIAAWAPVIRGHGIPESLEAILDRDSRIRPRAAVAKPLSAAVTIGTGGPFGAEGPIIVTGGSIGSLIGQLLSVSPAERKIMLATGAAAGMSATFNTPIAAVILAIELVLFERSLRVIVPLSIASAIAAAIHVVAFGSAPLFMVAVPLTVSAAHLPLYILVGLASGGMAIVLNKGLFATEAAFRRLPIHIFWWPAIGALGFALIGLAVPRTLSMGYSAITDTLSGKFTIAALAILLVAKLASWLVALGSQTSGGTLAPMFLVGASMGALLGDAVNAVFPNLHVSPEAFALVAMGATFGAATKALFAAVVFAAEVTGEYTMIVPLLIGAGVAELVAQAFLSDRLMTEKLSHRGFRVEFRTTVDALRHRVARQVMREPASVDARANAGGARALMARHGLRDIAVVDRDGRYLGLLAATELTDADPAACIAQLTRRPIAPVAADEYLSVSLDRFLVSSVDSLPVVDGDRVVGLLTRDDVVAERYRRTTGQEARQAGWFAGRLRPRRRAGRPPAAVPEADSGTSLLETGTASGAGDGPSGSWRAIASDPGPRIHRMTPHRLLPLPAQMAPGLGQFVLSDRSRITVAWGSSEAKPLAARLAAELRRATGFRLAVSDGRAFRDDISLALGLPAALPAAHRSEGYVLDVGGDGVRLQAPTLHGLQHGVQTIRQLLPVWVAAGTAIPGAWSMPAMRVVDFPHAASRCVEIDLADTAAGLPELMSVVERMVDYKLNELRLCGIAADGSGWTLDRVLEIAAFAAERFVTVAIDPPVASGAADHRAAAALAASRPVIDRDGALLPEFLLRAERAWSASAAARSTAAQPPFADRAAAQGPRFALTRTVLHPAGGAVSRLDLTCLAVSAHRRVARGPVALLIGPGCTADALRVVIDWGDGQTTLGRLSPDSAGQPAHWFTVEGTHEYRRAGRYRIAVTAAAVGAAPVRASVAVRVGAGGRLRPGGRPPEARGGDGEPADPRSAAGTNPGAVVDSPSA